MQSYKTGVAVDQVGAYSYLINSISPSIGENRSRANYDLVRFALNCGQ